MAVIDWEEVQPAAGTMLPVGTKIIRWPKTGASFADGDTGAPYPCGHYPDKTISVTATSYNSGVITIQGTNDPSSAATRFHTLHEPGGADLAFAANGMLAISENPVQIRPSLASGAPAGLFIELHISTAARR